MDFKTRFQTMLEHLTSEVLPLDELGEPDRQFILDYMTHQAGSMQGMLKRGSRGNQLIVSLIKPKHQITGVHPRIINWTALFIPRENFSIPRLERYGMSEKAALQITKMSQIWAWTLTPYRKQGYAKYSIHQLLKKQLTDRKKYLLVYSRTIHTALKKLGWTPELVDVSSVITH